MSDPWLLGVLLAGVIVLTPLADLVRVPQPVLLTVFGLLAGVLPFAAPLDLDPDLVLPIVLPPLLFAATQRTTSTEFKAEAERVLALAVGLTACTAVAVALVAHAAGLEWGPAWILGAVVSPPDPVAATAVARKLRLPDRLITILEGEGMFNDATALVIYSVALAAVVTGEFSYGAATLELVVTIVVGVAVGFAVGLVTKWLLRLIKDAYTETTITVVVPFVAYLGAEHVHGSGVLAVLVLGLYLRNVAHEATTSRGWLLGRSVWAYADFLITSLAFAVLGYELTTLLADVPVTHEVVTVSVSVVLTVVLFRIAWVFPVGGLFRLLARKQDSMLPNDWREITVVSWSGMRGVVTVATAVAIPMTTEDGAPFPDRHLLVVAALVCVLVTLVVQGLTLAPLTVVARGRWRGGRRGRGRRAARSGRECRSRLRPDPHRAGQHGRGQERRDPAVRGLPRGAAGDARGPAARGRGRRPGRGARSAACARPATSSAGWCSTSGGGARSVRRRPTRCCATSSPAPCGTSADPPLRNVGRDCCHPPSDSSPLDFRDQAPRVSFGQAARLNGRPGRPGRPPSQIGNGRPSWHTGSRMVPGSGTPPPPPAASQICCGRPASQSCWMSAPPDEASQIGCGRPASHSAWIGLAPPSPPGVGSWLNASQIGCGRPASQAGCSGLPPPPPPPLPFVHRCRAFFAFLSCLWAAFWCFLAWCSFLFAAFLAAPSAFLAAFFAFLTDLSARWALLAAFLTLVFCFVHAPALAVEWLAALAAPAELVALAPASTTSVSASATHPARTTFIRFLTHDSPSWLSARQARARFSYPGQREVNRKVVTVVSLD